MVSIADTHPHLLQEWDYERNDFTPDQVTRGSAAKIWWKCKIVKDHKWKAAIYSRTKGNGCPCCPCCNGKMIVNSNCLATLRPDLVLEWDHEKNNNDKPDNFALNSHKKIWWKCFKNHNWQAVIKSRINSGCPYCYGRFAREDNNLTITHPELIKEWNFELNIINPKEISKGSHKKVFWTCLKCNNIWKAEISKRAIGKGCNKCLLKGEGNTKDILEKLFPNIKINKNKKINLQIKIDNNIIRNYVLPDFSFIVNNQNIIVEYNGRQHYEAMRFGNSSLEEDNTRYIHQVARDKALREYCEKQNIILIEIDGRINFLKLSIEKYLKFQFEKHNIQLALNTHILDEAA